MKERGRGGERRRRGRIGGWSERRHERKRERGGHENIYIECASGVLLLQPTRPLFADCPSFACSVCSHPLPSYSSSSSSSVPPCVALRPFIPPTNDASHPQTHQLTLFQSYRTSLPCALSSLPPFLVSRPCLALHGPRLSLENPGLVSCRRITRSYLRQSLSLLLLLPSIHHFPFPFLSLSLPLSLFETKSRGGTNIVVADVEANGRR